MQEALEPGQSEWVGPWFAEPDRRIPGELIGAIGHREVDAGQRTGGFKSAYEEIFGQGTR